MTNKVITKRGREAIEILQLHPEGIHSFALANMMRWDTNYVPNAIREARKAGYDISSTNEKLGNAWGVRYVLISGPTLTVRSTALIPQKATKLIFNKVREIYEEVEVEVMRPATVMQGALL